MAPLEKRQASGKLAGIQYLRAVAAFLVVMDHAAGIMAFPEYYGYQLYAGLLKYGWIGVDIFFVVSGFIITVVSLQAYTLQPRLPLRDFAIHRFARIVPFMWLCVLTYAILRYLGRGTFELLPYVNAFFLWPIGEVRPNVIWTLRHELLFYIIFAVSFLPRVRSPFLLIAWFVSPIVFAPLRAFCTNTPAHALELMDFAFNPVNIEFGGGFLVGIAYLQRERLAGLIGLATSLSRRQNMLSFALAAFLAIEFVIAMIFDLNATTVYAALALGSMSAIALCMALTLGPAKRRFALFVELLGDASYSIYLVHNLVILVCLDALRYFAPHVSAYIVHPTLLLFALAIGVLIHLTVEKPVVRIGREALQGLELRGVGAHTKKARIET